MASAVVIVVAVIELKAVVNATISYNVATALQEMAEKIGSTRSWIVGATLSEWLAKAEGEVLTAMPASPPDVNEECDPQ